MERADTRLEKTNLNPSVFPTPYNIQPRHHHRHHPPRTANPNLAGSNTGNRLVPRVATSKAEGQRDLARNRPRNGTLPRYYRQRAISSTRSPIKQSRDTDWLRTSHQRSRPYNAVHTTLKPSAGPSIFCRKHAPNSGSKKDSYFGHHCSANQVAGRLEAVSPVFASSCLDLSPHSRFVVVIISCFPRLSQLHSSLILQLGRTITTTCICLCCLQPLAAPIGCTIQAISVSVLVQEIDLRQPRTAKKSKNPAAADQHSAHWRYVVQLIKELFPSVAVYWLALYPEPASKLIASTCRGT